MFNKHSLEETVMVDSLGLSVAQVDLSRLPNKFSKVGADDRSKWATGALATELGKLSLKAKGIKSEGVLQVEGSPAFHRQGHNMVSSNNATMLAFTAVEDIKDKFGLKIKRVRARDFVVGEGMEVTRIDTPVLLMPPAGLLKATVINGLALAGIAAGINTSLYVGETGYFDQHSQLCALKFYDKTCETNRKKRATIPPTTNGELLKQLVERTIRLEAVYRRKYLQRRFRGTGLVTPSRLTPDVLADMFVELMGRHEIRRDLRKPLREDQLMAIPRRYRSTVLYWQHGYDVLQALDGNRSEYSRHHTFLLQMFGIDINGLPPGEIEMTVELGEVLSSENLVPVPAKIRSDGSIFFDRDMQQERLRLEAAIEGAGA